MTFTHHFKPTHKEIKRYYDDLAGYATHEVAHEGATSTAFQSLLAATCKKADWHLVPQLATRIRGKQVRPDGTLRDTFNLHHGYWEAKDSTDKLDVEIRNKIHMYQYHLSFANRPVIISVRVHPPVPPPCGKV